VIGWSRLVCPGDDAAGAIEDGNVVRVAADRSFVSRVRGKGGDVVPTDDSAVAAAIRDGVGELGVRGRVDEVDKVDESSVRIGQAWLPSDDDAVVVEDGDGVWWLV